MLLTTQNQKNHFTSRHKRRLPKWPEVPCNNRKGTSDQPPTKKSKNFTKLLLRKVKKSVTLRNADHKYYKTTLEIKKS